MENKEKSLFIFSALTVAHHWDNKMDPIELS